MDGLLMRNTVSMFVAINNVLLVGKFCNHALVCKMAEGFSELSENDWNLKPNFDWMIKLILTLVVAKK